MRQFANHILLKITFLVVALVIVGAGVFSMAAMNHGPNGAGSCVSAMAEHTGCTSPVQAETCINFHFGLLEKLSHGFTDNVGFKLLSAVVALGLLFYASNSMLYLLRQNFNILKVRLRSLHHDTISVFYDSLGYWLTIFEKRDPSYAFVIA